MNKKDLEAFAREAAKGLKTQDDLKEFSQMLTKITVEAALNAELDDHLGYDRNEQSDNSNSRNGYTSKTLKTEDGQFKLDTLGIVKAPSNPSWSRRAKPALPRWMTRF